MYNNRGSFHLEKNKNLLLLLGCAVCYHYFKSSSRRDPATCPVYWIQNKGKSSWTGACCFVLEVFASEHGWFCTKWLGRSKGLLRDLEKNSNILILRSFEFAPRIIKWPAIFFLRTLHVTFSVPLSSWRIATGDPRLKKSTDLDNFSPVKRCYWYNSLSVR